MEFVAEDFAHGADVKAPRRPMASRLLPQGYEATFQAVGRLLDDRGALMIAVIECPSSLQIVGFEGGHASGQLVYMPFDLTLDDRDLHKLTGG